MCLVCNRINMIKDGTNPYFVKELETGYVVIGDHQHFRGYTLFLCKEHKMELFQLDYPTNNEVFGGDVCRSRSCSNCVWCGENEL